MFRESAWGSELDHDGPYNIANPSSTHHHDLNPDPSFDEHICRQSFLAGVTMRAGLDGFANDVEHWMDQVGEVRNTSGTPTFDLPAAQKQQFNTEITGCYDSLKSTFQAGNIAGLNAQMLQMVLLMMRLSKVIGFSLEDAWRLFLTTNGESYAYQCTYDPVTFVLVWDPGVPAAFVGAVGQLYEEQGGEA